MPSKEKKGKRPAAAVPKEEAEIPEDGNLVDCLTEGQKVLLTPKGEADFPQGPEAFRVNMAEFERSPFKSPFMGFCDQMLSPITPHQAQSSKGFELNVGARSPLNPGLNPSDWTPDILSLFGQSGQMKSMNPSEFNPMLPSFDPGFLPAGEEERAEAAGGAKGGRGGNARASKKSGSAAAEQKKDEPRRKKGSQATRGQRGSSQANAKGNSKKGSEAHGIRNAARGALKVKASPHTKAEAQKRGAAAQDSGSDATKFATPQPSKKVLRCPSRCLDFDIPDMPKHGLESHFMSPPQAKGMHSTPDSASQQLKSYLMPKTPSETLGAAPGTAGGGGSKRRRSCGGGDKCNCKKSKCLKLYCECFAAGRYCRPDCQCLNCGNLESNKKVVEETRKSIIQRDPLAFQPKIQVSTSLSGKNDLETPRHKKGCHCKRSHCLKKYCECFQAGIKCSEMCKCEECHNRPLSDGGPRPGREATLAALGKGASTAATAPATTSARGSSRSRSKALGVSANSLAAKALAAAELHASQPSARADTWAADQAMAFLKKSPDGPTLLKRVDPSTPSKKNAVFQIRGSIVRPPPSPLDLAHIPFLANNQNVPAPI